ncbi:unnamed protein product [Parascedosporium putredinis]|uniref:Small ribosomal subunit protein bS18m n=2 Tax=Parascedosporium putredinis TaxID=1442378 RepID=A0A9P1MBZ8_9PEZI|nr:unnamed protein product [Parascedosporium putredinis]CAI7995718.1 unnamed protein product [Parascedosporium putredinis]
MPPRIPATAAFKPALPLMRAITTTSQPKNPRASRPSTASNLLSLDEAPKRGGANAGSGAASESRLRSSTDEIQRLIARTDERYSRIKSHRADIQKRVEAQRMKKWRRKAAKTADVFDVLGNFTLISDFTTSMGQIQHSEQTGLRPANQRKVAKAIRRAMGMGLHPSVHRHPELLQMEWQSKRSRP